jgi:hypothetical protein
MKDNDPLLIEVIKIRKGLEVTAVALERLATALERVEDRTPAGKPYLRVHDVSGR